jgi:hypothetical protein
MGVEDSVQRFSGGFLENPFVDPVKLQNRF